VLKRGISKTNSCRPAPRRRAHTAAPPRHPRPRPPPTEATADRGRTPPETCSFPRPTCAPRRIGARAPRAFPSPRRTRTVHARAEERLSTAASRRRRRGHTSRVYLSTVAHPARPYRAALAVRRHGRQHRLGELLPTPATKLCTHAHPFPVTCNTTPRRALRRPRRRLASSQAAAAGAAPHHRPSSPAPLHSRLRPRVG
jgi:hypothetical protein